MSARLIGELTAWLLTPAAADLTPAERLVLYVVAERAHERTRIMLRHRGDDIQLVDRIAQTTGLARDGALKRAFQRLAARGLDVRIPAKMGANGKPVFTHEGHSMRFRLPEFPASVTIPEAAAPVDDPVDTPGDNPPPDPPDTDQRRDETSHHSTRGETKRPASEAKRRDESSRPTPSNYLGPSNKLYPSTSVLSPQPELEDSHPTADETKKPQFDFRSACAFLLQIPPTDQAAAITTAEKQLGPNATTEMLRIRAAQIAAKGIPA